MAGEHYFDNGPGGEEDPEPWLASVPPDPAPWDENPEGGRFIDPDRLGPGSASYDRLMGSLAEWEWAAAARVDPDGVDAALMGCTLTSPVVGALAPGEVLHAAGLVDSIAAAEAQIARLEAKRAFAMACLVRAFGGPDADPAVRVEAPAVAASEVAARLRLSQRSARAMVEESLALTGPAFAPVFEAMQQGRLTRRRAMVVLDAAIPVPAGRLADFAAAAAGIAAPEDPQRVPTVPALGRRLRRLAEDYADEPLAARKAKAAADRRVDLVPAGDGMCHLTAYLPLETGALVDTRLNAIARALQAPDEARTVNQLRADALADLLLGNGGPASAPAGGVRTELVVTVPAATLAGTSDTPGEVLGYGPIDPEAARRLAAQAMFWTRLVVAPLTGAPLAIGRVRYAPTAAMRRFLALRDATCRFPGCDKPAAATEADHTHEWAQGGQTDTANLALLCPEHHRLKTLGLWTVRQIGDQATAETGTEEAAAQTPTEAETEAGTETGTETTTNGAPSAGTDPTPAPPGTLEWTGPSGRRYITYPSADPPPPF